MKFDLTFGSPYICSKIQLRNATNKEMLQTVVHINVLKDTKIGHTYFSFYTLLYFARY
jgi:hypothetical protein